MSYFLSFFFNLFLSMTGWKCLSSLEYRWRKDRCATSLESPTVLLSSLFSKFYIPLLTPSKIPSREGPATFSISRTLHLDPGNPREERLWSMDSNSQLPRRARNASSDRFEESLNPRATLAKFTIFSFPISAAFISSNFDDRDRYFSPERKTTRGYTHARDNFPLKLRINIWHFPFAQLCDFTSDHYGILERGQKITAAPRIEKERGWDGKRFLCPVEFRLCF